MLYVPPWVQDNLEKEKELDRQEDMAVATNRILRQKDPRLSLILAKENATSPDLEPGRWHVERRNDGDAPNSYIPITGPNGEYVEPSIDRILAELNKRDMWREGAIESIYAAKRREKEADRKAHEARMGEAAYEAEVTAKVIMGQGRRRNRTAAAAAKARDNLPTSL